MQTDPRTAGTGRPESLYRGTQRPLPVVDSAGLLVVRFAKHLGNRGRVGGGTARTVWLLDLY